jgi:four helix bundle protein
MNTKQPQTSFHAFDLSLSLITALVPLVARIEHHDRDLGRQLRKAASSVSLNLGEGRRRTGKDRLHMWRIADGSAEESRVCLHVAAAWGYIEQAEAQKALAIADQILAICWTLTHR